MSAASKKAILKYGAIILSLLAAFGTSIYQYSSLATTVASDHTYVTQLQVDLGNHLANPNVHVSPRDIDRYNELISRIDRLEDKIDLILSEGRQRGQLRGQRQPQPSRSLSAIRKPQQLPSPPPSRTPREDNDVAGYLKRFFGKIFN